MIYRDKAPANYFRILTAKEDVETVAQALFLKLLPQLLQGVSLIPSTTWGQLPSDRKDYFHNMHLQFQARHSSFLLCGGNCDGAKLRQKDHSIVQLDEVSIFARRSTELLFV
jgi:hypothetical protein